MALSFKEQLQKTGIGNYPAEVLANPGSYGGTGGTTLNPLSTATGFVPVGLINTASNTNDGVLKDSAGTAVAAVKANIIPQTGSWATISSLTTGNNSIAVATTSPNATGINGLGLGTKPALVVLSAGTATAFAPVQPGTIICPTGPTDNTGALVGYTSFAETATQSHLTPVGLSFYAANSDTATNPGGGLTFGSGTGGNGAGGDGGTILFIAGSSPNSIGGSVNLTPGTGVTPGSVNLNNASGSPTVSVNNNGSLGFFGATPVVKPTAVANANFTNGAGAAVLTGFKSAGASGASAYTLGDIVTALKALGLLTA
jgi:hypothetical protein